MLLSLINKENTFFINALKYCELDTQAMIDLLKVLKNHYKLI